MQKNIVKVGIILCVIGFIIWFAVGIMYQVAKADYIDTHYDEYAVQMNLYGSISEIGVLLLIVGVIIAIIGAVLKPEEQKQNPEILNQAEGESKIQKEYTKPIEKMTKTKILGALLLMCITFLFIIEIYIYGFISITNIGLVIFAFTYIVGIALIMIKIRGTPHILMLICGIILLVIYLLFLLMDVIILIMNS